MLQTEMKRHMFKQHREDMLTVVGETKNSQTHLSVVQATQPDGEQLGREQAVREQAARDQMARDQVALQHVAIKQAARDQAAREQTARDQMARDQEAREQLARDQNAREAERAARGDEKALCLECRFECDFEKDLDAHKEAEHPTSKVSHKVCEEKIQQHVNKIERLELKICEVEIELKASKLEIKKSLEEKEAVQTKYREASTVISNQQRKITEFLEKIKVQDSLALIEQEKRGTDTNKGSEECEEVWKELDDNSGNMVSQRRKEISKYQWRPDYTCNICKKLFESDQQLRNHTKEHKRIQEQIIKCHHCDFMTNDADTFMNHTVVVHKRNFKCLTCELVFSSESELAMHAGQAHGLDYSKQKSSNKSIDCHDCEESFHNKFELMAHKKVKHFKKRLCSYYHGN